MNLNSENNKIHSQVGSAGIKLVLVLVVLILIGHAGYNYITVAYKAEDFKQDMHAIVMKGISMPSSFGKPVNIVKKRLESAVGTHNLPPTTIIEVKNKGKVVNARVYYQEDVAILPFGIYTYEYVFDHTVSPSGFLAE